MRKCDGYAYILNALYWHGKGKTMFSPILEVTSIQDGGALAENVYTVYGRNSLPPEILVIWEEMEFEDIAAAVASVARW